MGSYPPVPPRDAQQGSRGGSGYEPEILPPKPGYAPAPQPARRRRPLWAMSPATVALVGINCLVFLGMNMQQLGLTGPSTRQLVQWGADNAGLVLIYGEWWRIVTAMFVHVGLLHILVNMWCLWNLALLAEPLMGSFGVFAVYLLTGAAGNLLSTCVNWWRYYPDLARYHDIGVFPLGAGASGAVFGIAGALIVLLKSPRLPVPPMELRRLRKSVIYFAAINLVLGFGINVGASVAHAGLGIDNMAHLGGFLSGLLFAVPMVPRLGSPRPIFKARLRNAILLIGGLLVLFSFYLDQLPG
ncbi:MAG TPA: rhomboid family intramembrane serine protease [Terracidiphilus sp.]|nr:rhomboid family intramembrane serine protease [Terracidiphilus sp.]